MQLFVKKFFGFTPSIIPVITFSQAGSRDALLKHAKDGDRIVYVAVSTADAEKEDQGKILGMAEIGRSKINSIEMIPDLSTVPRKNFSTNGEFKWPEAIPMLRAWRFTPSVPRLKILKSETVDSRATRKNAVLLSEDEKEQILSLPHVEVQLPPSRALSNSRLRSKALSNDLDDPWKWEVARMAKTILNTVAHANGQEVTRTAKEKNTSLSEGELQLLIRETIIKQNQRCAITRRPLTHDKDKHWLAPSADRKDSSGHYERDNIQILSKAANMAKNSISPDEVSAFFEALQFYRE